VGEQRSSAQEGNEAFQKVSKWLFWVTSAIFVGLLGYGALLLGTIAPGDARIKNLYILSVVAAGVGTLIGALLNLRKAKVLFYGQVAALIALGFCMVALVGLIAFGGEPPVPVPDAPKPNATASAHVDKHQDCEGNWFTYEPDKAIDGQDATTWRVPGDGQGSWIKLDYTRPVKVNAIGIIPGHDKINNFCGIDSFSSLHVVRQVVIEFSDGTVEPKQFDRDRSMQWLQLDSPKTTEWVRIEIRDTYPPEADDAVDETAISEIEIK
jgi:hypothetical protein